jgi:glycosyltransferase involved in cell wall biosynthesis
MSTEQGSSGVAPGSRGRVLHITAIPATAFFLLRRLIEEQRRAGYEVELACSDGEYLDELREMGLTVHRVRFSRKAVAVEHLLGFLDVFRLCRRRRFDLVHTHTPIASFLGRLAAKAAGVKRIVYHMRASWWESSWVGRVAFTVCEWIAGRVTDHIFTINCADAADCPRMGVCRADAVTCLHVGASGLRLSEFPDDAARPGARAEARARLRVDPREVVIGFVGRMVPEKGIDELVGAFEVLAAEGFPVRLLVVGGTLASERTKGYSDTVMARLRGTPGLAERVIAVGFQKQVGPYLAAMDVLVLPSHREGFGMVVAEAAAFGVPSVATRTRGGRESVVDGETGFLTDIRSRDGILDALRRLVENQALRERMGRAARARAVTRFDERVVTDRILAVYSKLFGQGVGA